MKLLLQISASFVIFWETLSNTTPLSIIQCPKNMQPFYADKNSTRQICDCEDTFLYHPEDDSCYDAYRQGPCNSGQYFVLSSGEMVAKCIKNPCDIDGFVHYQGKCHILWERGIPCKDQSNALGVNEDFEIECNLRGYKGFWKEKMESKSCPENSYLFSTNDEHTSYVCECKTNFIYFENNNTCQPFCIQSFCPSINNVHLKIDYNYGSGIIKAPFKVCAPGSRRIFSGECKREFFYVTQGVHF
ncbi:uncharacterized protein LOC127284968 [Leptopilina boulardi]|uniref:uncharacterized protein LOC127284968 n=1 Tax=Leptopilina boulardi TaxID=63433 RepID=UPI0021F5EB39|nr:uncharacterized protein LOC127284968 [Leptopilina boulardi]